MLTKHVFLIAVFLALVSVGQAHPFHRSGIRGSVSERTPGGFIGVEKKPGGTGKREHHEAKRTGCDGVDPVVVDFQIDAYVKLSNADLGKTWTGGELTEWTIHCGDTSVEFGLAAYPAGANWQDGQPIANTQCTMSGMPSSNKTRVEFFPAGNWVGVSVVSGDFKMTCG